MDLKAHIRQIPDFPKSGIRFYDISTLLQEPAAWREAVDRLAALVGTYRPTVWSASNRGALSPHRRRGAARRRLWHGAQARQAARLRSQPRLQPRIRHGSIEISADLIDPGSRVVVIDDLIATGGTAAATVELLRKIGAEPVAAVFLIELTFLNGRAKLDVPVEALLQYDS